MNKRLAILVLALCATSSALAQKIPAATAFLPPTPPKP